jgi:molybdopterin synthase catalytic subunit/molybdopterin synthase sulfur carrier subunit
MKAAVQLFAVAKDLAGRSVVELDLPTGATVADVRHALAEQVPALATLLPRMMFAVNADYATDAAVIPPDADVACIPPVSGG